MPPRRDADLGTILCVWAHPDDESYLCAGLMAAAVDAGRRVVCVTATRGEAGFADVDPRSVEERTALRTAELEACLEVLGVTEHHWLDYPDGGCADVPDAEGAARIAELIHEVRPDTMLTFDIDGGTGHDDHMAVSRWTTLAWRDTAPEAALWYSTQTDEWNETFLTDVPIDQVMMKPDFPLPATPVDELVLWYRLDDDQVARKVKALRCQASQTDSLHDQLGPDAYTELARDEFFRAATDEDWAEITSR